MDKYPVLEGPRLLLNKLEDSDIPRIVEYAGNIKVAETTLNIPHPYEEKDAKFWINMANQGFKDKSQFTFAVRLKTTNEFLGGIGIVLQAPHDLGSLGYWIAEPYWNNGYATEAMATILKFGFEKLNLNKIFAQYLISNVASGKVMMKNGMIKEGELKEQMKKDGIYRSVFQYRLLKSEYLAGLK